MGTQKYKIGIIGAGPAGYTLALRSVMDGASVVLFEKENVGGTCLNKGCIPTKSILHNTNLINKTKKLQKFGIKTDDSEFDFAKLIENKNNTVEKLRKSLNMLLKSYDINIISEEVIQIEKNKIITQNDEYACENVVLATGTIAAEISELAADNKFIYNSDGILNLEKLPSSIAIIGSGAIGIEWSRIFSELGVEVTLIEALDRILPITDEDVSARLERLLKKNRVKIEKGAFVENVSDKKLKLSNGKELEPEIVLIAIGRKPILPQNGLDFETVKDFLKVDGNFMTNIPDVYAIGDINGLSMLAHSASHQAIELADYLTCGKSPKFTQKDVPSVIYGTPEAAWFGKSEKHLIEEGVDFKKSMFPISAIGKSHTDDEIDGFVKILTDCEKILSVFIVAPEASALLMQFLIAKENNLNYSDVLKAIFPHPTYSEAVFESILSLDNKSLSLLKPKE